MRGIVAQPCAIAHFGVEALAGGESFVFLYEVEDIERHLVVAAPRDIRELIVYERRHYVDVLPEHRLRIDGERCTGIKTGQLLQGAEIKVVGVKRKVHNIEVGCSKLWTI